MITWLLFACHPPRLDVCDCPDGVSGHAVVIDDACSCLEHLAPAPLPPDAVVVELSDGTEPDWGALDDALEDADVIVRFDPEGRWEHLYVERTDTGPHRLVLDGGGGDARAVVEGIVTPYGGGPRHRVTVRGFEITGSRDKGVFWEAGDDVWIEDVVVHGNRKSPAINLQYSSRSGVATEGFTLRNSHVYDQRGECIYIGGSEGTDADSHRGVVIENNLVHDCIMDLGTKHDGINVKDRMSDVRVHRNVVLHADWGIEVASAGTYSSNLVLDTDREGFQVSDAFSPIADMVFTDNAVIRPGHDGFHLATEQATATGMVMLRNTVFDAGEAGLLVASDAGLELQVEQMVVVGSAAGFDGWGDPDVTVDGCATRGNGVDFDRALDGAGWCTAATAPDVSAPAGPDGLFFTADDPWLVTGGAALPAD